MRHQFRNLKIVMAYGLPQNYNGFWCSNWWPLKGGEFCETWLRNTSMYSKTFSPRLQIKAMRERYVCRLSKVAPIISY